MAQTVKNLPAVQETRVRSLGWEDPLEKEMAIHSSILAWRIPWTEEPGGLESMGPQRVRNDWAKHFHFHFCKFRRINTTELEEEMANCFSILFCEIPWTEEPGGLQSMVSQSWTWLSTHTYNGKMSFHKKTRKTFYIKTWNHLQDKYFKWFKKHGKEENHYHS